MSEPRTATNGGCASFQDDEPGPVDGRCGADVVATVSRGDGTFAVRMCRRHAEFTKRVAPSVAVVWDAEVTDDGAARG